MSARELPDDPLDLDAVDQEIRINELQAALDEKGVVSTNFDDNCPPEVREGFLQNILDFENAPISCLFDALQESGIQMPEPEALDDAALHAKLWEVVAALAARSAYLYHTDHLSDRALYELLYHELLREEGPILPPGSGWNQHLDVLGGCSEEDIEIGLRYYDSEETRQHWASDFPDLVIPPHEDPPFDRDRLLPQPPHPRALEHDDADGTDEDGAGLSH